MKWEIGDELACTDCGEYPGDLRQLATCSYKKQGYNSINNFRKYKFLFRKWKNCDTSIPVKNKVKVRKCHIPCRPQSNQVRAGIFSYSISGGIPELPSIKQIKRKLEVAEPGETVIMNCNDGGRSLVNLPVAWRFTDNLNNTRVILRY